MKNKPKIEATGLAVRRERRDGDEIRLTTFIPIKIRKRGGRAVVVRPEVAQVQAFTATDAVSALTQPPKKRPRGQVPRAPRSRSRRLARRRGSR